MEHSFERRVRRLVAGLMLESIPTRKGGHADNGIVLLSQNEVGEMTRMEEMVSTVDWDNNEENSDYKILRTPRAPPSTPVSTPVCTPVLTYQSETSFPWGQPAPPASPEQTYHASIEEQQSFDPLGNLGQQCSTVSNSIGTLSIGSPKLGPIPNSDNSDSTEGTCNESENDCYHDIDTQKAQLLDRLMIRVHEIFTSMDIYTRNVCNGSTCSTTENPNTGLWAKDPKKNKARIVDDGNGKKPGGDDDDDDDDDEQGDGSRKRRRLDGEPIEPISAEVRMLACPYFKMKPKKTHPSRACSGPGWKNVSRIKEHLYRKHAMPPHCRRCYTKFDTETLLTEHSRATEHCTIREKEEFEGFGKEQEKDLKSRRGMFRAGSEEEKWRIVYLILFPDTPLGELPSPYYDANSDAEPEVPTNQSPTSPGLKQFDAFLRRELPRKIRKELQHALEDMIGPFEETLKNQLEGIIRDCQDTLTRSFVNDMQASTPEIGHSVDLASTAGRGSTSWAQSDTTWADGLSQFWVPPDSLHDWTDIGNFADLIDPQKSLADSAYLSRSEISLQSVDTAAKALYDNLPGCTLQANSEEKLSIEPDLEFQAMPSWIVDYTGKGKEKAQLVDPDDDGLFSFRN